MITVKYDDGGIQRSLDLAASSLDDLGPIFRIYDAWLRPEIDKVFAANDFAPLSPDTLAHREAQMADKADRIRKGAVEGVGKRLERERRKASKRLIRAASRFDEKRTLSAHKALARHDRVRAAFDAIRQGRLESLPAGAKRLPERLIRAGVRAENKIAALQSGKLLGQIANSIGTKIDGKAGYLEKFSHISWAGIHNDGGTAGHGAQEPQRRFLEWTPERIAKLAEIAADYVAAKIKKAA